MTEFIGTPITEYDNGLWWLSLEIAREVSKTVEGEATGGGATSLDDSSALTQGDSHWEGGTIWFKETGELAVVSSSSTKSVDFETQDDAVEEGDRYAVADGTFPYREILKAINTSLTEIGPIQATNDDLESDGESTEYDLPDGVSNIFKVKIVDPDEETSYYWSEHWTEEWGEVNAVHTGKLVFDMGYQPLSEDWKIVLYYKSLHPELVDPADAISPAIDKERLKWMAIVHLLKWGLRQYGEDSRKIPQFLEDALQRLDRVSNRRNRNAPVVRVHVAG